MQPTIVVKKGQTKDNRGYAIRYPTEDDVQKLLTYINELSREQTYINYQGEQLTLEQEQEFLTKRLEAISKHTAVMLVLEIDNIICGVSSIECKKFAESHVGGFGISLRKDVRSQGLGTVLMHSVLTEATKQLKGLRVVELYLFDSNKAAYKLYTKLGFVEYGRIPQGLKRKGIYEDKIGMYKMINSSSNL